MTDTTMQACIFDLDGVLTDSAPCHYQAWKHVADALDIHFDEEKNHLLRGVSRRRSLEIMIEGQTELSEDEIAHWMVKKNELFKELIAQAGETLLLPGVKRLLDQVRAAGYKTAVGSASKNAKTILGQVGLMDGYFDEIVDGTDTTQAKPDPEVFLLGAERLGVDPKDCIVFEDAPAGVDAAINAGMKSIGIGEADVNHANIVRESVAVTTLQDIQDLFAK